MITVKKNLGKGFENPKLINKQLQDSLQAGAFIVVANYKKESPVDHKDLRNFVGIIVQEDRVVVTTTATSLEGVRYPIFVGLGTGKFRGSTTDFGHPGTGRVRAGDTSGRGLGGIRPDMFHMRAKDKSEKKLTAFVKKIGRA